MVAASRLRQRKQAAVAAPVVGLLWLGAAAQLVRALGELDFRRVQFVAAVVLDLDRVAGMVVLDRRGHVVRVVDLLAVDLHEQIAAARDVAARVAALAAAQAGVVGGAVVHGLLDQSAVVHGQVEILRDVIVHVRHGHSEIGALDLVALTQLGEQRLGGVDRDREADPHRALARPAGGDLGVDPDNATARVEQRAARVAGVDRGIRLDDVPDLEAVWSGYLTLERRHDSSGHRALEAERVADRDHRVADLRLRGVTERHRDEVLHVARVDLQHREVGGLVYPLHLGVNGVAVLGEADGHVVGAGHDVRVGEDRAVLVDHEAGAGRGALVGLAEDRFLTAHSLGLHVDDAAGLLSVDVANGTALAIPFARRGLRNGRRPDDGARVARVDDVGGDQYRAEYEHDETAEKSGKDVRDRGVHASLSREATLEAGKSGAAALRPGAAGRYRQQAPEPPGQAAARGQLAPEGAAFRRAGRRRRPRVVTVGAKPARVRGRRRAGGPSEPPLEPEQCRGRGHLPAEANERPPQLAQLALGELERGEPAEPADAQRHDEPGAARQHQRKRQERDHHPAGATTVFGRTGAAAGALREG